MGDAAGIGPEIIVKALDAPETTTDLDALVIGDAKVMRRAVESVGSDLEVRICSSPSNADFTTRAMNLIDLDNLPADLFAKGQVDPVAGKAAVEYTEKAVALALDGEIDAITSAPVNKEAMHRAGYDFAGVTELLGHLTNCTTFAMVLVLGPIRLFYLTNHVSLRQAMARITRENVLKKIQAVDAALGDFGVRHGKIAVAAINPHGGEGGAMGHEEADEILPALTAARAGGIDAVGPLPADTLFLRGKEGQFDAILAMHHDQGNIAVKLLGFGAGVTVVTGLPIIRTSVAHGTAFDIAGEGLAAPDTLIAAIQTAGEIAAKRHHMHERS